MFVAPTDGTFDPATWSARWDAQQEGYVPGREMVFGLMADVVERLRGPAVQVLDLGCGPGSLTARVLERFPDARVVAVDADPLMLELGERTLAARGVGERVTWLHADLADPGWGERAGAGFDAAVSATALHWLTADQLPGLTRVVADRLAPGGVFLNFDTLKADPQATPQLASVISGLREERTARRTGRAGFEDFWSWWDAAQQEPVLAARLPDRDPDYGRHLGHGGHTLAQWEQVLTAAGFAEVATLTQLLDRRLLAAVR